MWENCSYIGGTDEGLIKVGNLTASVAMWQAFNRTRTLRRLRGKADLVVGSFTWGAPKGIPFYRHLQTSIERYTDSPAHGKRCRPAILCSLPGGLVGK
jgi:hypothetical protein